MTYLLLPVCYYITIQIASEDVFMSNTGQALKLLLIYCVLAGFMVKLISVLQ